MTFDVLKFCAKECEYQGSGEFSVYNYVKAWTDVSSFALYGAKPDVMHILDIGRWVEPDKNAGGFRHQPITIGCQVQGSRPDHIWGQIERLCEWWNDLTPQEVFQMFEDIHPFNDGNGRVGQLLFNWRNGTMENPVMAAPYVKNERF